MIEAEALARLPFNNEIKARCNDNFALCVADALWGEDADQEWSADTLDAIVEMFKEYRPDLVPDLDPHHTP